MVKSLLFISREAILKLPRLCLNNGRRSFNEIKPSARCIISCLIRIVIFSILDIGGLSMPRLLWINYFFQCQILVELPLKINDFTFWIKTQGLILERKENYFRLSKGKKCHAKK